MKTFECRNRTVAGLAVGPRVMLLMMTSLVKNDGDERHSFVSFASWVR
jgi:hypothetical protein